MPAFTFPQSHRLKTPPEFKRVYDRKRSASDDLLVVYAGENDRPHPRLGVSVSRKVGGAVVRNRVKRLFREAFRLTQHELPAGVDFILIPRVGVEPDLERLKASLVRLARQAARKLTVASGGRQPPVPVPARPPQPQQGADAPRSPGGGAAP
jgi:ribonuclease P protein component